ncbi:MAG TPA: MBL fold metallo-hydrolase [Tepidisphaeraceae bacterium]|nr:MBL fold metallo-hydrolase [Tepidisphaeraceae bacterium]
MPSTRLDIISIGTLSRNRLWNETAVVRTAHATTTLIRAGNRNVLVDPGLPAAALGARLYERTGMKPEQIETVFLTNSRPAHRAGLSLFTKAKVLIHEIEQQSARQQLQQLIDQAPDEDIDRAHLKGELDLIESFKPADDEIADGVDLFPLFGYTPGTCGLLVSATLTTTLIAGDAVPTLDHFLAGQVLPDSWDIKAAHESMAEVYEIADLIVPGHDNLFMNPRSQGV